MNRLGDILYGLLDDYTGEAVEFRLTGTWLDGTAMTDGKCDGVLYRKLGSEYFQRVLRDDVVQLAWYGVVADGQTDNLVLVRDTLLRYPRPLTFRFPKGDVFFSDELKIVDREHRLHGHPQGTRLVFAAGKNGVNLTRTGGSQGCQLYDLQILSNGRNFEQGRLPAGAYPNAQYPTLHDFFFRDEDQLPNWNGSQQVVYPNVQWPADKIWHDGRGNYYPNTAPAYTCDPGPYAQIGLAITSITRVENVRVAGFNVNIGQYGNVLDKSEGPGGFDCSRSFFENVTVAGGVHGWTIGGSDANLCTIIGCEARDNIVGGLSDFSFLGNGYREFHCNNNRRYHYVCTNPNNRSTFTNCYGENGNYFGLDQPSYLSGAAIWDGGIHGPQIITAGNAQVREGQTATSLQVGNVRLRNSSLQLGSETSGLYLKAIPDTVNGVHWAWSVKDFDQDAWQIFSGDVRLHNSQGRLAGVQGQNFRELFLDGSLQGYAERVDTLGSQYLRAGQHYRRGDVLWNKKHDGTNPEGWRCISPGRYNAALPATTGAYYSGATIQLSGNAPAELVLGDAIAFQGQAFLIIGFQDLATPGDRRLLQLDGSVSNQQASPVTYAVPRWKATGSGAGTLAQRPANLRSDDAGWRYFGTDTNAWTTWTGASWV